MKKFNKLVESVLNEKTDFGKYEDKFALSPSQMSEIIVDAAVDDNGEMTIDQKTHDKIMDELEKVMEKIWKKYEGKYAGADPFWKEAAKIGKKYGLTFKR